MKILPTKENKSKEKTMDISLYTSNRSHLQFKTPIKVVSCASAGGTKEKNGPLGNMIDLYFPDETLQNETWEKQESDMVHRTFLCALEKAKISEKSVDILLGGDLMNQCTGCAYGLSEFDVPYFGLYGACSTFCQGLILASSMIESGTVNTAAVCVSSHFATAERQYRYPLDYGSFSAPTAQNTVTGCGAVILSRADKNESGIFIDSAMPGIVIDRGIKDAANMGAAMASAAADTTIRFLKSTGKEAADFDLIATGDLGEVGHDMEMDMLRQYGIQNQNNILRDCGTMIYDVQNQSVGAGGSGCGCSAVVTSAFILSAMSKGAIKNAAVIGTGAMMSPQSLLQGLSIPSVAHLVSFKSK